MARRQGFFDDLMSIGLTVTAWKVALAAALVIFVALHVVAIYTQTPVTTTNLAGLGSVVQRGLIHALAEFLQYVIPAGLLIGTTVGFFKQRRSGVLFPSARMNPKLTIISMTWRDFERLVGEAFRQQGFTVTRFGGQGPDGGVDFRAIEEWRAIFGSVQTLAQTASGRHGRSRIEWCHRRTRRARRIPRHRRTVHQRGPRVCVFLQCHSDRRFRIGRVDWQHSCNQSNADVRTAYE